MVEPDHDIEPELAQLVAERFERAPVPPPRTHHDEEAARSARRALLAHGWAENAQRPNTDNPPEGV